MRTLVALLMSRGRCVAVAAAKSPGFPPLLVAALAHFTYVALAVFLVLSGLGLPIPEDIPLVAAGYMCHPTESPIVGLTEDVNHDGIREPRHIPRVYRMICAGMIGVLLGDTIIFRIGKQMSSLAQGELAKGEPGSAPAVPVAPAKKQLRPNLVVRHLRKVMHSRRREKVERHFAKHGNLTIFVGRFLPGFRSLIFAFAGMSKMSYWQFLLIDGLAAAISVPTFILLGYAFAPNITILLTWIDRIKHWLLPPLILAIIIAAVIYTVRRRRRPVVDLPAE